MQIPPKVKSVKYAGEFELILDVEGHGKIEIDFSRIKGLFDRFPSLRDANVFTKARMDGAALLIPPHHFEIEDLLEIAKEQKKATSFDIGASASVAAFIALPNSNFASVLSQKYKIVTKKSV